MSVEVTEKTGASRGESNPAGTPPASERVSGEHEAPQSVRQPPDQRSSRRRRLLIGALGALVLAALGIFGIPWILASLNTVSTDDAYVNGHATFIAPRVAGQISRALVDDNNRVHKGELLAELDKQPFEDAVAVKRAAVDTAEATCSASSRPLTPPGNAKSVMSKSMRGADCKNFSAVGPSPASRGRYPSSPRTSTTSMRTLGSSSTTSTVSPDPA